VTWASNLPPATRAAALDTAARDLPMRRVRNRLTASAARTAAARATARDSALADRNASSACITATGSLLAPAWSMCRWNVAGPIAPATSQAVRPAVTTTRAMAARSREASPDRRRCGPGVVISPEPMR
jgi:hypothetical protein